MKTKHEMKGYAQIRSNETGKPYLITEFSVLLDDPQNRKTLKDFDEQVIEIFHPASHVHTIETENETLTLAGIEFRAAEIQEAIDDGREWLAKGRKLYLVGYSENAGFSARPVHKERGSLPLVARGRFRLMTAGEANSMIGFELCLATEGGEK